ncbi:hypothetical protein SAMN02745121_01600 [Nannocystis exedens]|uniref:Uncharacterized protein n=1 Tax=Nannocystis exedens TaxID=54 RepID=A0A1I1VCN6_9BACT|nr:hypothetical protein NAEX_05503 [Nannocystis exedens]SFD78863.1 hypothetical protein SAMN02745121_01600 [Nannocystis exedens]
MSTRTWLKRQMAGRRAGVRRVDLRGALGRPRRARGQGGGGRTGEAPRSVAREPVAVRRAAWRHRHVPIDMFDPGRPARGVVWDVPKDRRKEIGSGDACLEGPVPTTDERPRGPRERARSGACERSPRRAGGASRGSAIFGGPGPRALRGHDRSGRGAVGSTLERRIRRRGTRRPRRRRGDPAVRPLPVAAPAGPERDEGDPRARPRAEGRAEAGAGRSLPGGDRPLHPRGQGATEVRVEPHARVDVDEDRPAGGGGAAIQGAGEAVAPRRERPAEGGGPGDRARARGEGGAPARGWVRGDRRPVLSGRSEAGGGARGEAGGSRLRARRRDGRRRRPRAGHGLWPGAGDRRAGGGGSRPRRSRRAARRG